MFFLLPIPQYSPYTTPPHTPSPLAGGGLNPQPATVNERADCLRAQGLDEANIQAAMKECGVTEKSYARDAWGRIIAVNDVKYSPFASAPPADAFGQLSSRK